jgi:hypothetical protein
MSIATSMILTGIKAIYWTDNSISITSDLW